MASCSRVIIRFSPKISSKIVRYLHVHRGRKVTWRRNVHFWGAEPPLPLFRGMRRLVPQKACLAELDIDIAELDKANHQQHNGYTCHAQDVAPVQDAENRVAI